MPDDQYCLRWNNHHPNLIAMFSSLLQNDQMVDVTLILENSEIHAHKIVLSACSPFFQNIFLRNSCKHPVIVLTGIKYLHMKSLIEFIYNGEVNIFQEDLSELLRIANILKIKGLDEMPSQQQSTTRSSNDDTDITVEHPFNQTIKVENLPSTSEHGSAGPAAAASKAAKKRKSVSFSDTPEIVCNQQRPNDASTSSSSATFTPHSEGESGNGKRKMRSLSDICSITKVEKQPEEAAAVPAEPAVSASNTGNVDDNISFERANKNQQLVVTINPHAIYSSSESINMENSQMVDNDSEPSPKKPQHQQQRASSKSRKMIRKNENFLRALEAVRDKGIGFCKAAKIHGVNNRTLWLEYQKRGYPMKNARKNHNK